MRLLVDAHTVICAVDDPSKLSAQAATALQAPGNDLLLSAGTIWEIAIKVGLGKLSLSMPYRDWMNQAITDLGMTVLPSPWDTQTCRVTYPGITVIHLTDCLLLKHRWRAWLW